MPNHTDTDGVTAMPMLTLSRTTSDDPTSGIRTDVTRAHIDGQWSGSWNHVNGTGVVTGPADRYLTWSEWLEALAPRATSHVVRVQGVGTIIPSEFQAHDVGTVVVMAGTGFYVGVPTEIRLSAPVPDFSVGQRVGIVTGLQAVGGPTVATYGTVTDAQEFWNGTLEYQVTPDDGSEALWYRAFLLRPVAPSNVAPFFDQAREARLDIRDNVAQSITDQEVIVTHLHADGYTVGDALVADAARYAPTAQTYGSSVAGLATFKDVWSGNPDTDKHEAQDIRRGSVNMADLNHTISHR